MFKKLDKPVIKWNKQYGTVDIIADGEKFRIDAVHPSFVCSWNDAMRYFDNMVWTIPTLKQLQVLAEHIEKVNEIIREHNGFEISGCLWSCKENDKLCAWYVYMCNGNTNYSYKYLNYFVRAVSVL